MIGECDKLAIFSLFLRCVYAGGVPPKEDNSLSLKSFPPSGPEKSSLSICLDRSVNQGRTTKTKQRMCY